MKKTIIATSGLILGLLTASSFTAGEAPAPARVIDVSISSRYIKSPAAVTIGLPEGYSDTDGEPYPVVYILNGHGGNNRSWNSVRGIDTLATEYDAIIVCPDGRNSWYWDSPIDPRMQMESYITRELVPYIDAHYHTVAGPQGRAIAGLSMGGHGALWLAIRHADIFGSAASTSGGVNITPFPKKWNMADRLGAYEANPKRWRDHSVMAIADTLSPGRLNLHIDCGTSDFFYKVNNQLDSLLNARKIPHTYTTSPGAHTWQYWRKSIIPIMDFFHRAFLKQ